MDIHSYFNEVTVKFKQDGFTLYKDDIGSLECTVATKKQFKWSWLAVQMNFFAIMGFCESITEEIIENFSKNCLEYAIKNNKGLPRGLQSGVVSFPLLVSSDVDENSKEFAQTRPKKHFAAMEMPVIFDLKENELYYYDKTPIWGGLYAQTFRNFIETYFRG